MKIRQLACKLTCDCDNLSEMCRLNSEHALFSCMAICKLLLKGCCTEEGLREQYDTSVLILSVLPRNTVLQHVWLFLSLFAV